MEFLFRQILIQEIACLLPELYNIKMTTLQDGECFLTGIFGYF